MAGLSMWSAQQPLDERVAGQYLLALHQAGRSAGAFEHYQQVRTRLIEELATEPGIVAPSAVARVSIAGCYSSSHVRTVAGCCS
ncbi:BTAD domain-containing putative transcriptional regulator [Saccharothrix sp. NRRL B-16314]|uniref:BTAD domain-containing putative transcriptional regulator n=1 Tax=Saccharothrix sp. NRRL B-16314 TaxID=1463825 RepID=UPI000523F3C9|nr:BTAD domain-containing putative transcriptional regulator [Saccharothrix sp. NRRL B-16314]